MEQQHPIPQNVTSFEFKLVGDMTLKQFLYLCIGIGIAYATFLTILAPLPFLAWPIIIISSSLGAAFAFVPIADRPLDYWLGAFLKAIYSPTQRKWVKDKKDYSKNLQFQKRFQLYQPNFQPAANTTPLIQPQNNPINPAPPPPVNPPITTPTTNLPTEEELKKTVELAREAQSLQVKIVETERQLNQIKSNPTVTQAQPAQYSQEINEMLENLQKMVDEASMIKQQLAQTTHQPQPPKTAVKVSVIATPKPKLKQLILTTFPNVINGIVADSQNNYLTSAVVVIYDKEGLPVRALKTNKLGQFTGATPLPNGIYTIQTEKDSLVFDMIQIELTGNVLPPILILAKGGQ